MATKKKQAKQTGLPRGQLVLTWRDGAPEKEVLLTAKRALRSKAFRKWRQRYGFVVFQDEPLRSRGSRKTRQKRLMVRAAIKPTRERGRPQKQNVRAEVTALRKRKLSRGQIAKKLGISVSLVRHYDTKRVK